MDELDYTLQYSSKSFIKKLDFDNFIKEEKDINNEVECNASRSEFDDIERDIKFTGNLRMRSYSNALHGIDTTKNTSLEKLIEKKHEIAEKVDSFLMKSRMFSMKETDSGDEQRILQSKQKHLNLQHKSHLKAIKKYTACKNLEAELVGTQINNINFDLLFTHRGELKTTPSYSVNYSKYMINPEEFKAEELAKKQTQYCNYEEFLLLEKSLRSKLNNVSESTAIDLIMSIYPQLWNIIESQIELSAAFNYLSQNWRQIITNPSHPKLLKNLKIPSLALAFHKESYNTLNTLETEYGGNAQVSLMN